MSRYLYVATVQCKKQVEVQTSVLHSLVTVGLHHINDVEARSLDVENLEHLLVNHSHRHRVGVRQAADGSHGYGPITQSAAYEHTAAGQSLLLPQAHSYETFVPISLVEIGQRQLLDLTVDPENPTNGFHTLNTCRGVTKRCDI